MITDEILEAFDMLVEMMGNCDGIRIASALREMLGEFDEFRWNSGSEAERKEWLQQFMA